MGGGHRVSSERVRYHIAVISTVKNEKGPMYHLLVGISANGYTFSDIPTDK